MCCTSLNGKTHLNLLLVDQPLPDDVGYLLIYANQVMLLCAGEPSVVSDLVQELQQKIIGRREH